MIIINMNSGLGNQMFQYALFLRLKRENQGEEVYFDTSIYEAAGMMSKLEIDRIFNLELPNISSILTRSEYQELLEFERGLLKKMPHNWLSKAALLSADKMCNLMMNHVEGSWEQITDLVTGTNVNFVESSKLRLKRIPILADLFYKIKPQEKHYNLRQFYQTVARKTNLKRSDIYSDDKIRNVLCSNGKNKCFVGNFEQGSRYFAPITNSIRQSYRFPPLDERNESIANKILQTNSVAMHVRLGDHLQETKHLLKPNGYFSESVSLVKEKITNPVFFIFSDNPKWCKDNLESLGLSNDDKVTFVEGNSGINSFRDMQLMSLCANNIIPISTFSWWASFLNPNTKKTVVAPKGYWCDATVYI